MPDFAKIANLLNAHGIETRIGPCNGPRLIQAWCISPASLGLCVSDAFVCPANPEVSPARPYLMLAEDFDGYFATLFKALQAALTWSNHDKGEYTRQWDALLRLKGQINTLGG